MLSALTGFDYSIFVQSGTAAQQLVMSTLFDANESVSIPALGCWTIPTAVLKGGATPAICDIDQYWGLDTNLIQTRNAVVIDPWSVPSDWARQGNSMVSIVDITLAPGATNGGKLAGEVFIGGFLSLGAGKPLDIGAGGVALFRCPGAAREAMKKVRFGIADGSWITMSDRYVFSASLLPLLETRLIDAQERLISDRIDGAWLRSEIPRQLPGFQTNPVRPGCSLGLRSAIPIVLPEAFPLTPKELEAPAIMSGLALTRHPVGPPYLEPAWHGYPNAEAKNSEDLARRLMFFEPRGNPRTELAQLCNFIGRALEIVPKLKLPYVFDSEENDLYKAASVGPYGKLRVCRGLNRSLYLYDEVLGTARVFSKAER